jgi:hypothetical protein
MTLAHQRPKRRMTDCSLSPMGFAFSFCIGAMIALLLTLTDSSTASAQSRVDLEDLDVKGELLNDNRLRMTARDSVDVGDRIHYRKDFRPEIVDGLDLRIPASETEQLKSSGRSSDEFSNSSLEAKP